MSLNVRAIPYLALLLSGMAIAVSPGSAEAAPQEAAGEPQRGGYLTADQQKAGIVSSYGQLPLRFERNEGQAGPTGRDGQDVQFLSRGKGYALYLSGNEAVIALRHSSARATAHTGYETRCVRMQIAGAAADNKAQGEDILPGVSNYFPSGDPATWRTGLPSFSRVRYKGVYSGIDLVYYGNQQQLEYDFVVAPQADARAIQLHFAGASRLALDREGNLIIHAGDSADEALISFHRPVVYQMVAGQRRPVAARFALLADNSVSFALGRYDHSQPLVIDPTLIYSTLLGGSTSDTLNDVAIDGSGNAYITGYTTSADYPVTPGAYDVTATTAFVTKLNPSGTALVYSTYLGTGATANAIAVDSSGEAYVTGFTSSATFPVTSDAFQKTNKAAASSNSTGFLTKLNAAGTALAYSTFLGGSRSDTPTAIVLDSANDVYLAGYAFSNDFPTTPGAYQTTNLSYGDYGWNEFVTKLNPAGTALLFSTMIGGSDEYDSGAPVRLAVDSAGEPILAGSAIDATFPVTAGAYNTTKKAKSGYADMTVTKFNATGTKLIFSTWLGGSSSPYGSDTAYGLTLDSNGSIYIAGFTWSTDYPTTKGAYQTALNAADGLSNGFVTKMNSTGTGLVYSTFLGGSGRDGIYGLAVDSAGNAYVNGSASSLDFPVTSGAFQTGNNASFNEGSNAFLTEINPTGSSLVYSTYMGGSAGDFASQLRLTPNGGVYMIGDAGSSDFPTTKNAYKTVYKSQYFTTGWVAEFNFGSASTGAASSTQLQSNANPAVTGSAVTFTASVTPAAGTVVPTGSVVFNIDQANVATVALNSQGVATYNAAGLKLGGHAILATYGGSSTYASSAGGITENIVPATPVISPAGGAYPSALLVTLSDATAGATIYYTVDGSTPTTSSTKYAGPFLVGTNEAVIAVAAITGVPNSELASALYRLVDAPASLAVPAAALTTATATLNALVNTNGMSGSYYFRWGTASNALTAVTPTVAINPGALGSKFGFAQLPVSAVLGSLKTKTTYFYQVVVTTQAGISSGAILSFTTN